MLAHAKQADSFLNPAGKSRSGTGIRTMNQMIHLKRLDLSHVDDVARLIADPDVSVPANFPCPLPEDFALKYVRMRIQEYEENSSLTLAVLSGREFVGTCSLHSRYFDLPWAELTFWIGKPYWGRGFASLAVEQTLIRAFEDMALELITARCFENNLASQAVLARHEFQFSETVDLSGSGLRIKANHYQLTREQWRVRRSGTALSGTRHQSTTIIF